MRHHTGTEWVFPVQQQFGETQVATIHFACAFVFILSLAAICFYFA